MSTPCPYTFSDLSSSDEPLSYIVDKSRQRGSNQGWSSKKVRRKLAKRSKLARRRTTNGLSSSGKSHSKESLDQRVKKIFYGPNLPDSDVESHFDDLKKKDFNTHGPYHERPGKFSEFWDAGSSKQTLYVPLKKRDMKKWVNDNRSNIDRCHDLYASPVKPKHIITRKSEPYLSFIPEKVSYDRYFSPPRWSDWEDEPLNVQPVRKKPREVWSQSWTEELKRYRQLHPSFEEEVSDVSAGKDPGDANQNNGVENGVPEVLMNRSEKTPTPPVVVTSSEVPGVTLADGISNLDAIQREGPDRPTTTSKTLDETALNSNVDLRHAKKLLTAEEIVSSFSSSAETIPYTKNSAEAINSSNITTSSSLETTTQSGSSQPFDSSAETIKRLSPAESRLTDLEEEMSDSEVIPFEAVIRLWSQ